MCLCILQPYVLRAHTLKVTKTTLTTELQGILMEFLGICDI